MSNKVDMFLLESGGTNLISTPRPPVPGEENEKESNGGQSTKSSGSYKSHSSNRSLGSNKGDINNPATPRKSNIDKLVTSVACEGGDEDMNAPLGFEPEGSVANSPPFTENSTPPYLKWAESLHHLLDDPDGVHLFRTFLQQEQIGTSSIDFWYACRGLKTQERSEEERMHMVKIIFKKLLKGDKLPSVNSNTKKTIAENINHGNWADGSYMTLFDDAQSQVENYMKNDTYPLFLKSDLYVQYVAKEGDSPNSSNSSSGSNSASRPVSSGPLPTLKEDQELGNDDFAVPYSVYGPPLSKHQSRSVYHSEIKRPDELISSPYHPRQVPHHVSYAPTSAQDSEIQSLSSQDTYLTDDTQSMTDSSVDGHSLSERRSRHSKKSKMHSKFLKAQANRDFGHNIPRTERGPKDRNIAETDCKLFADMLIEKLLRVQKEREKEERMQMQLKALNKSEMNETLDKTALSSSSSKNNTTATSIVPLLTSSMIEEENANSILDEHCSRIWERSAQQTPSRSPGRHSPRSKSPDRFRKGMGHTSSMPGTLHGKNIHGKKRTDFAHSMSSFDSGMGDDLNKCSVETHKHIHHHHHHHHEKGRKNKQRLELAAQQHSMVCWGDGTPRHHSASATRQRPSRSASSDACSNKDSGISMIESYNQEMVMPDPANIKVLQWIMENENMNRGTSSAHTDSDKTSSTRRSHKSALNQAPQQQYKQSSSKKGSSGHMNRSSSADSGNRQPWIQQGGVSGIPCQPIAQDPSMPLIPPPNTRVQLEEVNRRLNSGDAFTNMPIKSKSFTGGVSGKDRRQPMMSSYGPSQDSFAMPSARTVPADLDLSEDMGTTGRKKRSGGSGNTSGSSKTEEISVGYYLLGEPIPYKTTIPQSRVTLGLLKQHISKRGNFRYFVKTYNNDFDSDAVFEEIKEDSRELPVYDGKILVKVERKDDLDSSKHSSGSEKKFQL